MTDVALILIAYAAGIGVGFGVGYAWGQRNAERHAQIDGWGVTHPTDEDLRRCGSTRRT